MPTEHSPEKTDGHMDNKKTLSLEEVGNLTERIYTQSILRKKQNLEKMESRFYQTEEPKRISKEQAAESANRQVNAEMERRKKKNEELQERFYKPEESKKMTVDEIQESLRRVYEDSMRMKKDNIRKLNEKHSFKGASATEKSISKECCKESAERLSKPKKTTFTDEEINKIYGF